MNMPNTTVTNNPVLAAKLAALCGAQKEGGGRNAVMATRQQISKKKFVEGEAYLQIIPAILATPFNPTDYQDDSYSMEHRFLFKNMSAYSGVKMLKSLLLTNPDMAEYAASLLGVSVAHLELNDPEVSDSVQELFKRWRTADVTSYVTQKLKFNDPQYKFGRSVRLDIELDAGLEIVEGQDLPLSIRLHQMETALIAAQVKLINQSYESGVNQGRTKADQEADIKAAWKNRKISNPYPFGTMRTVIITTDREFVPAPEMVTALNQCSNFFPYENYTGVNNKFLMEEIEARLGTKKDRYFDFFALKVDCKSKATPDEALLETIRRTVRSLCGSDEEFTEKMPTFQARYRAYRDDENFWKPEIMLRSVSQYRVMDDTALLARMKDDISTYDSVLGTKDIVDQYAGLIASIDAQLSTKLLMLSSTEELPTLGVTVEDLSMAPRESAEDTTLMVAAGADEGIDLAALTNLLAGDNE